MFVDEKKAQNVSEVGENKVYMGSVACNTYILATPAKFLLLFNMKFKTSIVILVLFDSIITWIIIDACMVIERWT